MRAFKQTPTLLILLLATLAYSYNSETCSASQSSCESHQRSVASQFAKFHHINIVLFGATGNLAKKYLWNSLLQTYEHYWHEYKEFKFSIYAIGRDEKPEGRKFLSQFFLGLPKCVTEECQQVKKSFSETVQYVKIVTVRDFLLFEKLINENTQSMYGLKDTQKSQEIGRLFYLAIPPSAYLQTLERIHKHLLPQYGHPWVRVVLEKPFGTDLESARLLSEQISNLFNESQVYRVDHYLCKSVVQEILSFRVINEDTYGSLWNKEHIERVEVVMKERLGVARRTATYNEMGVMRDVMQNHLTEMFLLVAMELPSKEASGISDFHAKKLELLQQTSLAGKKKVITGQYSTYNAEWLAENNKLDEVTDTATYAATLLQVDNGRWQGVPFVMEAGKKLEEKASYVRVVFKAAADATEKYLVFYVDGKMGQFIAASKDLPSINFKKNWKRVDGLAAQGSIVGSSQEHMSIYTLRRNNQPYQEVLKGVIEGSRHFFVPVHLLKQSWRLWDEALAESRKSRPRKYLGLDKDAPRLHFKFSLEEGISFLNAEQSPRNDV